MWFCKSYQKSSHAESGSRSKNSPKANDRETHSQGYLVVGKMNYVVVVLARFPTQPGLLGLTSQSRPLALDPLDQPSTQKLYVH